MSVREPPDGASPFRLIDELRLRVLELEVENEDLRDAQIALEESRGRYADLWDELPVGACEIDERGVIQRVNGTAARMLAGTPHVVGRRLVDVMGGDPRMSASALRVAVASEEGLGGHPDRRGAVVLAARSLRDGGRTLVTLAEGLDRRRALDILRFLADSGRYLGASLDADEIAGAAVRMAVPFLGDLAAIDLHDEREGWRRAAVAASDPGRQAVAETVAPACDLHPFLRRAAERALEEPALQIVEGLGTDGLELGLSPERRLALARLDLGLAVVAPLVSAERTHGVLIVGLPSGRQPHREIGDEQRLIETFAQRVATALANAVLHRQVVELNQVKDEFLAQVSHELRTPLAAVLMWAEALRVSRQDPARWTLALDSLEHAARLQSRLVEDLVDLARGMAGKLQLALARVRVLETMKQAVALTEPEARERTQVVEVAGDEATVWADPHRLTQIFVNLLGNAIKFGPEGGLVSVAVSRSAEDVIIEVRDRGIGIEPEFLPLVFEHFRQQRPGAGLGVGLAIVRQLVTLHGGSVEAASRGPGRGATFTVRLPTLAGLDPP